jgi:molybdopterin/thiamine biosynthesis adenylyltransferase
MADIIVAVRPTLSEDEVKQAVKALHESGYVDEAPPDLTTVFSTPEVDRYSVNMAFYELVAGSESAIKWQSLLKGTHVLILGLGGIGSNVAVAMAELGVGTIVGLDYDSVELRNLNRQILYSTPYVGERKVQTANRFIHAFNPNVHFVAVERRIASEADVRQIINDYAIDFVFCLADKPNGHIDFWVNIACQRVGIPYVGGSISGPIGTAYGVVPGQSACYQCEVDADLENHPELVEELDYIRQHDVQSPNSALGPACMFLAYFLSYEFLRYRLGLAPMLTVNQLFQVNFVTFSQIFHAMVRRPNCPICSNTSSSALSEDRM